MNIDRRDGHRIVGGHMTHQNRAMAAKARGASALLPYQKASRSSRWARIMVKWLITRVTSRRGWEIVNFTGRRGAESRGIVDLLAIRKDHTASTFQRGDLFEIILIQVKGGGAKRPTRADLVRLRAVARRYRAKAILLAEHRAGRQPVMYQLSSRNTWVAVEPREVFK